MAVGSGGSSSLWRELIGGACMQRLKLGKPAISERIHGVYFRPHLNTLFFDVHIGFNLLLEGYLLLTFRQDLRFSRKLNSCVQGCENIKLVLDYDLS